MVNYLTLILCCISAFIAGGIASVTWAIFREKDIVEQIKARLPKDQRNYMAGDPAIRERVTVKPPARPVSNTYTGSCPVENCSVKGPHSHTEALIRRVKEK
jgi:hypothetical protein